MFCPKCGRSLSDTANFCSGCGLSKVEIDRLIAQRMEAKNSCASNETQQEASDTVNQTECTDTPNQDSDSFSQQSNDYNKDYASSYTGTASADFRQESNYSYPNPPVKNENLSTVDFIWVLVLSAIPFFGIFYLIYLAFIQTENTNKRSYARAVLIIGAFSVLLTFIFVFGFILSGIAF